MSENISKKGRVWLVGAGPGDPGLLTVRARELLERADAVVYDRLADPRLLALCRDGAEKIYVGKASSRHALPQKDINALLVRLASEGKDVVRLKGGDPLVFGRGGEEALTLRDADIAFEFVPGVTSAIAAAEYAGIPVTHRGVAASFAVITGHEDPTKKESGIEWRGLATCAETLVFLMGVENIENISARLIENGRPADQPAAIVRWGTRPEQRTLVTTVGRAAEDVRRCGIEPPAIFVVGEVVRLRDQLSWYETKPLFGKTVVVTRAREQASELSRLLEDLGAAVIEAPTIKITPPRDRSDIDRAVREIASYDWLILTSVNGVRYLFDRIDDAGLDSRSLCNAKVAAIGSATAEALRARGIRADVVPEEFRAEGLVESLKPLISRGDRVLIARASEAREILPRSLRDLGAEVDVVAAYETETDGSNIGAVVDALKKDGDVIITFTSSSTVKNFVSAIGEDRALLSKAKLAAIGPITAQTMKKFDLEPDVVAETYTIDHLVEAVKKLSAGKGDA